MSGSAAPGWYPDPSGSGGMRWWDGQAWHDQVAFARRPVADHATATLVAIAAAAVGLTLLVVGAFVVADGTSSGARTSARTSPTTTIAIGASTGASHCGCAVSAPAGDAPATAPRATTPDVRYPGGTNETVPAHPSAMPSGSVSALVTVDSAAGSVTVESNLADIRYTFCASFAAVSDSGNALDPAELRAGDFAVVTVDPRGPCVSRVTLVPAPQPPACVASGYGGGAEVTIVGYNGAAHSVLYRPTGPNEPVLAARWCAEPPIVGADGSAISISQVSSGARVELMLASNGWVTSITLK